MDFSVLDMVITSMPQWLEVLGQERILHRLPESGADEYTSPRAARR